MIVTIYVLGCLCAAIGGFAFGRLTDRPREPQTDEEHAALVNDKATDLNLAMHNARAVGLNPCITISPIDDELAPALRPFIVGVQRGGKLVEVPR
jgi:hypothetical protein